MQRPLPSAGPTIAGAPPSTPGIGAVPPPIAPTQPMQQGPAGAPAPAAVSTQGRTRPYAGWYPRWWLLSAFICALLMAIALGVHSTICIDAGQAQTMWCGATSWVALTGWGQAAAVAGIWAAFFGIWVASHSFLVGPIEFQTTRPFVPMILREISQYRAIYSFLWIYAFIALVAIFLLWYFNVVSVLAFSLCSLIIFVANSQFFHRLKPRSWRRYIMAYALMAAVSLFVMLKVGRFQPTIGVAEGSIFLAGVWAAISLGRMRRAQAAGGAQAQPSLQDLQDQALEPAEAFRELMRTLFRRNPHP